MKVLIADDDPVSRRILGAALAAWGYDVEAVSNGGAALTTMLSEGAPPMAILNWMMPQMDGVEVCRLVRQADGARPAYLILLTSKEGREDVIRGLLAGADDYLTKPFDSDELRARVQVGRRVVDLQSKLATHVGDLEQALSQVKRLEGMLPICSYCKRIRDDANYWQEVERYIAQHSEIRFSHGICPDCYQRHIEPVLRKERSDRRGRQRAGES